MIKRISILIIIVMLIVFPCCSMAAQGNNKLLTAVPGNVTVQLTTVRGGIAGYRLDTNTDTYYYANANDYNGDRASLSWYNSYNDVSQSNFRFGIVFGFHNINLYNIIVSRSTGLKVTGEIILNTALSNRLQYSTHIMYTQPMTWSQYTNFVAGGFSWAYMAQPTPTPEPTPTPYPTFNIGFDPMTPPPSGIAELPPAEGQPLELGVISRIINFVWNNILHGWGVVLLILLIAAGVLRILLKS